MVAALVAAAPCAHAERSGVTAPSAPAIFEDLKLSVADGERLAIIGANGCGKSTLLSLLAGTLQADAGTIHRAAGSSLRLVTQVDEFGNATTIAEAFAEQLPDVPEHEIAAAMAALGADPTTLLSTLSGGWRKRVALAIAEAAKVDYLLLDEPTNHLNLAAIRQLEQSLQKLPTIIFVGQADNLLIA